MGGTGWWSTRAFNQDGISASFGTTCIGSPGIWERQASMLIHRLAYEFPVQRPPVAIAAAKPTIARTTSTTVLTVVARPPANEVAYPALSRLLDDAAIRIAA